MSMDGDGGGTRMAPGRRNPKLQMEHEAELIIYFMKDRIHIGKNKHDAITGNVSIDILMDSVLKYFARRVHNDIAVVFQEGLYLEMKKAIRNVLDEHELIKEVTSDTFRRESI